VTHARWAFRPHLPAADRRDALDALMVRPSRIVLRRFAILLALSVVVAAVGLLQDSTAVIIGAMMIAPMMSPIMGLAASLVMGWWVRLLIGLAVVTLSVVGAIAISWGVTQFIPAIGATLPTEVLSRSSPDIRDLLVALAAGAAGAYATVRRDVSGALPGVAVAVALVPPLASAGVLMGRHQPSLARGAGLLFATNLFGIVLAAAIVFLLTGLVPASRFRLTRRRILLSVVLAAVPTLLIASELTIRFSAVATHARKLEAATQNIVSWLGPGDDLSHVSLAGSVVDVNISGPLAPPSLQTLTDSLTKTLGQQVTVNLAWTPVQEGSPTPTPSPTPAPAAVTVDEVRPTVQEWLAAQSSNLDGLSYDGSTLVVSASGRSRPKSGDDLAAVIDNDFGTSVPVSLVWTKTGPQATPSSGPENPVTIARATVDAWLATHPGTAVLGVDQANSEIAVTLVGAVEPDVNDLKSALQAALPQTTITLRWVAGSVLDQLVPTPATSFEPPSSASAPPAGPSAIASPSEG
jgi:uncharacterized hydrophobic protein (TIGR00271 family)